MENFISVYERQKTGSRQVYSNYPFFKDKNEIIFSIHDDKIILRRVNLDWNGKTYIVRHEGNVGHYTCLPLYIPVGKYYIDEEESDDDKLIFYINEKEEDEKETKNRSDR